MGSFIHSQRRRVDRQLGCAHERPAFDLAQTAELDKTPARAGKGDILEGGVVAPAPLSNRHTPGLAIVGDPDLELLDATVRRILARHIEKSLDLSRGAEFNNQLVRVSGRRTDELGAPDRGKVAVACPAWLVARRVAVA